MSDSCASIEGLHLDRRFDAVLLLSNRLTVEPERRRPFLDACRRHSELLVVETLPLAWKPRESESLRIDRERGWFVATSRRGCPAAPRATRAAARTRG